MPTKVIMPQLGESVIEGTVTKWLVAEGDTIEEYEAILEVTTDKVDTEIPSPAGGVLLTILVEEGLTVNAGTTLAWIGDPGDEIPEEDFDDRIEEGVISVKNEEHLPAVKPEKSIGQKSSIGFISPIVAKIAGEHNINLENIDGSGQNGRITKKDVLKSIALLEKEAKEVPKEVAIWETPADGDLFRPTEMVFDRAEEPDQEKTDDVIPGQLLPLSPLRKAIADHMIQSKSVSPHVTTVMEVDLSNVVNHRLSNKVAFSRRGIQLTFTPYFIAAVVKALKKYPIVNSSWKENGIAIHKEINIGMATAIDGGGLIVPVIKNADEYSISGLAKMVTDLAQRGRSKKLLPDEVQRGTFTLTNHGVSGSLFASPIINQPQCGILGVGMIQKRVIVINDAIAIRPMVYLSLTFDHRILDGVIADSFLMMVVKSLENFK